MSKEYEDNFDDDFNEDKDEGNEDTAGKGDKTAEELAAEQKAQEEAEAQEAAKAEERAKSYRPSGEGEKEKKSSDAEHVPLSVHLELKNKYKDLKKSLETDSLTKEELSELAEETGIESKSLEKLITKLQLSSKAALLKEVDARVKPIVAQKISSDNDRLFSEDFEVTIAKKYPELADKKENFKRIAFSKEFMHLKTLEDIRKEFYPGAKSVKEAAVKTDAPEGGSKGTDGKELESINFAKMDDATHKKVLADPTLRAKYYAWQDSRGL